MLSCRFRAGAGALALLATASGAEAHIPGPGFEDVPASEEVIVTGEHTEADVPNRIETVDAAEAETWINAVNSEDMLKYLPSITVRKRHYGDTQDPLATRTNGVGASARSLLFVDGILISSPIGNNNSSASPHFGIAQPEDIGTFQVLYGPFAAEYGGGSIGAVLNITTVMPERFTIYADALGGVQPFNQYGTHQTYGTWQFSGGIGDRAGAFSWRLSATHLDSVGQPLAYVTLARPPGPSAAGAPVTGAFDGRNRTGAPISIVGAAGIEAQLQDTQTLKLAYDFAGGWQATYTASLFHQSDNATAQTYLQGRAGDPVFAGDANIGGRLYAIPARSFSNNVYDWRQTHLAQAVTLKSAGSEAFAWEFVASDYDYLSDEQRVPGTALPGAMTGGGGTINRLNGTGWYTLDAKGVWKGWPGHQLSFGAHRDAETFSQVKHDTANWLTGGPASIAAAAKGRTATDALWLQDIWSFAPGWKATIGGRFEQWRAYDGTNYSAAPSLDVRQPKLSTAAFSPKLSLAWTVAGPWTLTASWGGAYRMPTVTELYQAVTTGTQLTVPNPDLRPEHAGSYELAAEYRARDTRLRLSLFREDITDALLSQSAPLVPGSTALYSYVQNIDRTRAQGIELVAERSDALIEGLDLSGSLTYAIGRTVKDRAFPAAQGKFIPQLPKLRGSLVATYHATQALALTLAGRYSDRSFGTIDNSDFHSATFQGFGGYLVADIRLHYRFDSNWSAALGIDNINNDKYFLYHPFPQRTFLMEIHYAQ
jgi:iron complex outermembrane receptor protein